MVPAAMASATVMCETMQSANSSCAAAQTGAPLGTPSPSTFAWGHIRSSFCTDCAQHTALNSW